MLLAIAWVVLFTGSDAETERALTQAAQSALGEGAVVRVIEVAQPPSDEAALELARAAGGDSVASVVWLEPRHMRVRLRAHSPARGWLEREIEFAPGDAPSERGRTLGFNLASMLAADSSPSANAAEALPPSAAAGPPVSSPAAVPPPAAPTAPPSPTAPVDASRAVGAPPRPPPPPPPTPPAPPAAPPEEASIEPTEPAKTAEATEREPAAPALTRNQMFSGSLSTAFSVNTALGGSGDGIGGALGGQFELSQHLGLRLDLALRTGPIDGLHATGLAFEAVPGLAWSPRAARPEDAFSVALQIGLVARYHAIFRPASMARGPETHGRFVPGAALTAAGTFWFARELGLLVRAGAESAFGKTELYVGQRSVATLVPLSLLLEAGFSARF